MRRGELSHRHRSLSRPDALICTQQRRPDRADPRKRRPEKPSVVAVRREAVPARMGTYTIGNPTGNAVHRCPRRHPVAKSCHRRSERREAPEEGTTRTGTGAEVGRRLPCHRRHGREPTTVAPSWSLELLWRGQRPRLRDSGERRRRRCRASPRGGRRCHRSRCRCCRQHGRCCGHGGLRLGRVHRRRCRHRHRHRRGRSGDYVRRFGRVLRAAVVLAHELLAPRDHAPLAAAVLDAEDVGTALRTARHNGRQERSVEGLHHAKT